MQSVLKLYFQISETRTEQVAAWAIFGFWVLDVKKPEEKKKEDPKNS